MRLFDSVRDLRSLAIVGMCKNAGKTTALTRLLWDAYLAGDKLGLSSIGRDGERTDLVSGTKKPPIYVYAGTLVATAEGALDDCDFTRRIVETTGITTPLGRVVVVEAESDGYAMIAGPSMNEGLIRLNTVFTELGVTRFIIDGALFRKSFSAPEVCDGVMLCTGASYSRDLETIVRDTANAARMLSLPVSELWASAQPAEGRIQWIEDGVVRCSDTETPFELVRKNGAIRSLYLKGAVTEAQLRPLLRLGDELSGFELCAENGSRFFLPADCTDKLLQLGAALRVRRRIRLCALTVNPFSAYGAHQNAELLLERMRAAVDVPVFDVLKEGSQST